MGLIALLGEAYGSEAIAHFAETLSPTSANGEARVATLEVKEFPPVTYASSRAHGLSIQFERGSCQAIDIYNEGAAKGWSSYSDLPLTMTLIPTANAPGERKLLKLEASMTGTDFVSLLGEPSRKGGGEPLRGGGASGLGPGAWMEWRGLSISEGPEDGKDASKLVDLMVELKGPDARGAQRWDKEKGGQAKWGILTISLAAPSQQQTTNT